MPATLFVFNPEFVLRRHSEPYAVLTAMRGLDVVDVQLSRDPISRELRTITPPPSESAVQPTEERAE